MLSSPQVLCQVGGDAGVANAVHASELGLCALPEIFDCAYVTKWLTVALARPVLAVTLNWS